MKEQEILSLINERLGISDLNDLQKSVLKNFFKRYYIFSYGQW